MHIVAMPKESFATNVSRPRHNHRFQQGRSQVQLNHLEGLAEPSLKAEPITPSYTVTSQRGIQWSDRPLNGGVGNITTNFHGSPYSEYPTKSSKTTGTPQYNSSPQSRTQTVAQEECIPVPVRLKPADPILIPYSFTPYKTLAPLNNKRSSPPCFHTIPEAWGRD